MTTTARRVAAIPVRTSTGTWDAICNLLAQPGTTGRVELESIKSLAGVLIAEEYTSAAPIVVTGAGPRVRVYTVHGDDAVDAEDEELPLTWWPCDGSNWEMSLPCAEADMAEMAKALAGRKMFSVRDLEAGVGLADSESSSTMGRALRPVIDLDELSRT